MTEAEYQEAIVQATGWVKHPGPALSPMPVEKQRLSLERRFLRELLKRAGAL